MPRRPTDANLYVRFERREVLNHAKSYGDTIRDNDNKVIEVIAGANRPVFDNVDYVHIEIPGDKGNITERPVMACVKGLVDPKNTAPLDAICRARKGLDDKPILDECDVHRFFEEYSAFRAGQGSPTEGTPLRGWALIDRASCEELAYFHVTTVEQLATLNDSNAGQFFHLRERARDWLDQAKKNDSAINVRAELDAERARVAALEKQMQELLAKGSKKAAQAQATT